MPIYPKFNRYTQKPLVLLSPLDWGLGHTTRCIPVIQQLIESGCTVIVACNERQQQLLSLEFPGLQFAPLAGYGLRYGSSRWRTIGKILWQIPQLLIRIKKEKRWVRSFIKQHPVDAVISDNRFGFYAEGIPSIFITHQLTISTSLGAWADKLVQQWNYRRIRHFNACWVPDYQGEASLAGQLSNPGQMPPIPLHYLGALSRLKACPENQAENIDLLIILSGPEPQRTIFEKKLLPDLEQYEGKAVLLRALPDKENIPAHASATLTIFNHLPAAKLNELICRASIVISRPGYTTVMDLLKLGKKSIMVPTPGQGEQEYLGRHLMGQQYAFIIEQEKFSLQQALASAAGFPFKNPGHTMQDFQPVLREFTARLTDIGLGH